MNSSKKWKLFSYLDHTTSKFDTSLGQIKRLPVSSPKFCEAFQTFDFSVKTQVWRMKIIRLPLLIFTTSALHERLLFTNSRVRISHKSRFWTCSKRFWPLFLYNPTPFFEQSSRHKFEILFPINWMLAVTFFFFVAAPERHSLRHDKFYEKKPKLLLLFAKICHIITLYFPKTKNATPVRHTLNLDFFQEQYKLTIKMDFMVSFRCSCKKKKSQLILEQGVCNS